MFDGLLVAAANAVAELLALDPDAASHARDPALDPETIGLVFDSLDANHDGLLTAVEAMLTPPDPVLVNDPVLLEIYESFRVPAVQAVKLGAGNEDVASFPGVALADLPRDPVPFFGFETLRRLSLLFVSGEEVAGSAEEGIIKSLWAKLAAAERAESEGDLGAKEGALDAFVAEVDALAGRKLTHDAAATLAALAKAL